MDVFLSIMKKLTEGSLYRIYVDYYVKCISFLGPFGNLGIGIGIGIGINIGIDKILFMPY